MNWQIVRVILLHELRMLLRYRRTVVLAVILPLLTVPAILLTAKFISDRREKHLQSMVYRYAVVGSDADRLRELIARGKQQLPITPRAETGEDNGSANFSFEEVRAGDAEASLQAKKIQFYIEGLSGAEADALSPDALKGEEEKRRGPGQQLQNEALAEPGRLPGVPAIRIFYLGDQQESSLGRAKMRDLLLKEQRIERDRLLLRKGFPVDPALVMKIEDINIASAAQVTGSYLGRFLTLVLLMLTLSGGSIVAIDSIAGEKERGSLETLLTTAASRGEIVAAKQILIFSVALFITVIQVANLLVYVSLKIVKLPKDWVIDVPPGTVLAVLFLFLPLAAFIAAVLLLISAYAKSYKEAQLYFFPVNLVSWVPAMAGVLPGISLRSAIALVPIANVSVAVREIMVGKFDWPTILLVFLVMTMAAVFTARASARLLTQEKLITASEADVSDFTGGPALFPKHVLRWYAVMGAILFIAALNMPQSAAMRGQILFNELLLFLGAALLMIWRYRLDAREALALRRVRSTVWLAVMLTIPSGTLVGVGIFKLANLVFPVPERMLEQFARQILPADVPTWQLVLLVAVVPGICEEISFRGLLLYGLRRRFRPIVLALVVGLIFGLFHVTLFRIIPTAFLGVTLTALALLTGSIFPCIVVHAGNNALAVLAGTSDISMSRFAWWVYILALGVFALSYYVIYRNRTPYPGLRVQ